MRVTMRVKSISGASKFRRRVSQLTIAWLLIFLCGHGHAWAERPLARKVLVLYNSLDGQNSHRNPIFQTCQTILNYYGLLTEYRDVNRRPLPDATAMMSYRGIITWFHSSRLTNPNAYLTWLLRQLKAGRKVVVLGNLGGTMDQSRDPELKRLINTVYRALGLKDDPAAFTTNQSRLRYVYKDPDGVQFERPYPFAPPVYEKYTPLHDGVKAYLQIRRTDVPDSRSTVVFTSPTGGFAMEEYAIWAETASPYRQQWYLNPFLFFEEALGLKGLPHPDPTTLNGMRVAFSHIDGDGFGGISRTDRTATCAEIIRDQILKKYPFPVTVSVIVGEIDPKAAGQPERVRLAREIFALANVEPAAHGYSHLFYWDPDYDDQDGRYDHRWGIHIPGYTITPEMEIDYAVRYVTQQLAPAAKPCRVFLWTGNCRPLPSHIARADALGVYNMNGGDTIFDDYNNSYTTVAPLYERVGTRYQFHSGQANENILTNLWKGPFYGYREIITTMQRTDRPRRLNPIDIYYHFYSGEYQASLKALQDVYAWALTQEIAPVFTSDYIRMAKGYLTANIRYGGPEQFIVSDYGDCLTVRFDTQSKVPDLNRCQNVLGYTRERQGLYVALNPGSQSARIVLTKAPSETNGLSQPVHVRKATGWISAFDPRPKTIRLVYKGFGQGRLVLGGFQTGQRVKISGTAVDGQPQNMETDSRGRLTINRIKSGSLTIQLQ